MKQTRSKRDIIKERIKSGEISTKINPEKQKRHILGKDYIAGRSYIYGDLEEAQRLVDILSGTGEAVLSRNGAWTSKEWVTYPKTIGVHIDKKTGTITITKNAMIIYSNTGTHIVPRRR